MEKPSVAMSGLARQLFIGIARTASRWMQSERVERLYRYRVAVFTSISALAIVITISVAAATRSQWVPFAGTSLHHTIQANSGAIMAHNYARVTGGVCAALMVFLDLVEWTDSSVSLPVTVDQKSKRHYNTAVSVMGRLHALVGYVVPSAMMIAAGSRDEEWLCVIYSLGNALLNVCLANATGIFLSTRSDPVFSVVWMVPLSIVFAISAILNSTCDLLNLFAINPAGAAPRLASGLTFPLYVNAFAIIWFVVVQLQRRRTALRGKPMSTVLATKLLYGLSLLALFCASVGVNTGLRGGPTAGYGSRSNNFYQVQALFFYRNVRLPFHRSRPHSRTCTLHAPPLGQGIPVASNGRRHVPRHGA